jgi:uncharacterized membrane protein YgcG
MRKVFVRSLCVALVLAALTAPAVSAAGAANRAEPSPAVAWLDFVFGWLTGPIVGATAEDPDSPPGDDDSGSGNPTAGGGGSGTGGTGSGGGDGDEGGGMTGDG